MRKTVAGIGVLGSVFALTFLAPGVANATDLEGCSELASAALYHTLEGNHAYASQLNQWMAEGDCARFDFIPIKDWVFQ